MLGAPTESWTPLRNTGQWVIGTALGLYFTPEVGALIAGLWWAVVLGVLWALILGLGFGAWLRRVHAGHLAGLTPEQLRSTTYFAGAIGGASEMTLIAERQGARTDLVAAAHSLRVLLVTVCIPFAMQYSGVAHLDLSTPGVRDVHVTGLVMLAGLTLLGALAMRRLGRANPWFMGALLVTMVITLTGNQLSAIPSWLSAAAQLVIGISLGVRFTPAFVHTAPRWLASVAFATVVMMGLCAAFGGLMAAAHRPAPGHHDSGYLTRRHRRNVHHRQGACNSACPWSPPSRSAAWWRYSSLPSRFTTGGAKSTRHEKAQQALGKFERGELTQNAVDLALPVHQRRPLGGDAPQARRGGSHL